MESIHLLITQIQTGDRRALNRIIELWYKRIYNFSFKFLSDHNLAMEVTQKTFINMYKKLHTLQTYSLFRSWLYSICINKCKEEIRKSKNGRLLSLDQTQQTEWKTVYENPEHKFQQTELSNILLASLHELKEEQRVVVIMKEYEGFKFREIARILNVPENTVKSRMYGGLEALRKIFERKNITRETIGS